MSYIYGQNLRISLGNKIIAASTNCQIAKEASLEDISTKDSTGNAQEQGLVSTSWSGSADAVVVIDSAETGLKAFDAMELVGTKVGMKFEQTTGVKNRTAVQGSKTLTGDAWITNVTMTAPNKSRATYSISFSGDGVLSSTSVPGNDDGFHS